MSEELTQDGFLGGRLALWQPSKGYRAGVDPVLLAASVEARPGQSVLDMGCGAGAAALCLAARVGELDLHGLELQPLYARLAARNARENGLAFTLHEGDIAAMPAALKARRFDHVMTNPPYFDRASGTAARDAGREMALGHADLTGWLNACARRLAPKGWLTLICRAERVPELLAGLPGYVGSAQLWPIVPRSGRASQLVLMRARHGGRAPFCLHADLVMHDGDAHERDAESYTPEVRAVLRDAAALPFPKN